MRRAVTSRPGRPTTGGPPDAHGVARAGRAREGGQAGHHPGHAGRARRSGAVQAERRQQRGLGGDRAEFPVTLAVVVLGRALSRRHG